MSELGNLFTYYEMISSDSDTKKLVEKEINKHLCLDVEYPKTLVNDMVEFIKLTYDNSKAYGKPVFDYEELSKLVNKIGKYEQERREWNNEEN